MPLSPGRILNNRYRIVSLIAQGGFGAVYKAWDLNLKGLCAVKENFKLAPAEQQQFEREASLLFKLHHPNLPRVFDQFSIPGEGQFLVMDYVEGQDLGEMIQSSAGPLSEVVVIGWLSQVCDALTYLHGQTPPVIHRDIKPNNIKITPDGRAVLVDFGIAKTGITGQATTEAARGVTPGYSPPEQYNRAQTDARTDIYALGATLYALLTRLEPPASTDRVAGIPLLPPRQLNQAISPALEKIILKAMAIEMGERYLSAAEFKAALLNYKNKPSRPAWLLAVIGIVLLLCLAAGGVAAAQIWPRIFPASRPTEAGLVFPTSQPSIVPGQTKSASTLAWEEIVDLVPTFPAPTTPPPKPSDTPIPENATPSLVSTWQQGKLVYLARSGGGTRLYMQDLAAGLDPVLIYSPPSETLLLGPTWSPDGAQIALAQLSGPLSNFLAGSMQLRWVYPNCDVPSWSPDGTRIICHSRGTGVFNILNTESGALVESYQLASGAVHPTWSPTGNEIAYSMMAGNQTSIWRADVGEGALPVLLAGEANENYAPTWSPDGQVIAFQSTLGSPLSDLWTMDRNGGSLQRVLYTNSDYWSRAPSYSPDGQWLAYVSNQAGSYGPDYGEVFVVSLNTGEVVQLTHTGGLIYDWRVDWGP